MGASPTPKWGVPLWRRVHGKRTLRVIRWRQVAAPISPAAGHTISPGGIDDPGSCRVALSLGGGHRRSQPTDPAARRVASRWSARGLDPISLTHLPMDELHLRSN